MNTTCQEQDTDPIILSFRLKDKNAENFRSFRRLLELRTGFKCTYGQAVSSAIDLALRMTEIENWQTDKEVTAKNSGKQ